jgi:hypothetical protein
VRFTIAQPTSDSNTSSLILRKAQTEGHKAIIEANGGIAGIWEIILSVTGPVPDSFVEKTGDGVVRISFEEVNE